MISELQLNLSKLNFLQALSLSKLVVHGCCVLCANLFFKRFHLFFKLFRGFEVCGTIRVCFKHIFSAFERVFVL